MSEPWVWLVLETSGRGGRVGLAVNGRVVRSAALDPARRHNRDLAPAVGALLAAEGRTPADLAGVMVSHGPGSFTGLRVGVMSAKMLAYATGCALVAVPTFHAIAEQSPMDASLVDVISDGLQGHVYVQRYQRLDESRWEAADAMRIEKAVEWVARLAPDVWVSGPGVDVHEKVIPPEARRVAAESRVAGLESLFAVGRRLVPQTGEELMRLEPLYLRASSAEEKMSG